MPGSRKKVTVQIAVQHSLLAKLIQLAVLHSLLAKLTMQVSTYTIVRSPAITKPEPNSRRISTFLPSTQPLVLMMIGYTVGRSYAIWISTPTNGL